MRPETSLVFDTFRLDPVNEQLWCGPQLLPLRPKTFAVLRYLVEHAGALVVKEELLQAVWPGAHGAEALPKKSVYELRKVLGDEAGTPRFIETAARRGWRFIAQLAPASRSDGSGPRAVMARPRSATHRPHCPTALVGRETESGQLHQCLEQALLGERRIVFVTGEPGIGKTALVDAFLGQLADDGEVSIARGQCVEHHGAGEAYLPVLAALARLGGGPDADLLLRILRRHAPTWLVQMPSLIDDVELEALQRRVLGAAKERMLREMAEALEAFSAERPLALFLEDLQWSDYSTLDLLLSLARWHGPARLMLIGTYRPADVVVGGHPLRTVKQELQAHGQCVELALPLLTAAEVDQYLTLRFDDQAATRAPRTRDLARIIHQNTEGNPLFMVNMVEYLTTRGVIAEEDGRWEVRARPADIAGGVPDTLRQLIERQFERLALDEQRVLEAASVAGAEFTAMAAAAALGDPAALVEEWCDGLARGGRFLASEDTERLADGTITARYRFLHALYQKVLYERVPAARRARLHRQIAESMEALHGAQAPDAAAELALHFERGHDHRRAIGYLEQAARNALRRSANREAIDLVRRALTLLRGVPDTRERAEQELALQVTLAVPLMMTQGYTAPEVRAAYERAHELCQVIGPTPHRVAVLVGLSRFRFGRSSPSWNGLEEKLEGLGPNGEGPSRRLVTQMMLGGNLFFRGEFPRALALAEQGITLYDPLQHRALIFQYGDDPQVLCLSWAALALWYLGRPDRALSTIDRALQVAQDLSYPFGLTFARYWTAFLHQARGEVEQTREHAGAVVAFADTHGIPQFSAMASILVGWAKAEGGHHDEGIDEIRQGMANLQAIGQQLGRPYFSALLAEALRRGGRTAEALELATEALAITYRTGERMHQAELSRLRGELLHHEHGTGDEAERCLRDAVEIARRQGARSLELRAVMSLGRWWQEQGQARRARPLVAEVYRGFTEGFETRDVQEASALLAALERRIRLPRRRRPRARRRQR